MRLAVACVLMMTATAHAEHWPIRTYTTADGLANDRVDRIARDAAGALWFATFDGVSRFDGHEMTSFGVRDGLPAAVTHDVLAAADGTIWVATDHGLAWFDPREPAIGPVFHPVPLAAAAISLAEDRDRVLWVGTTAGLARVDRAPRIAVTPIAIPGGAKPQIIAITPDPRDRSLWLGTWSGLVHRAADGTIERYPMDPVNDDRVFGVLLDRHGRLWIGHVGPRLVIAPTQPGRPLAPPGERLWDYAEHADGWLRYAPEGWTRRGFCEDSDGTIWVGTTGDLVRYDGRFAEIGRAQIGIEWAGLSACVEDVAGNLWFGSGASGAVRLARRAIVAFDRADGLDTQVVYGFVESGSDLYVITARAGHTLNRRDGDHFVAVRPHLPPEVITGAWGWGQSEIVDRDGRWWYPTGQGVARYPRVARVEDLATAEPKMYTTRDGLPGRDVFRLYEDRRGDVWISVMSDTGLARWDRATDRIVPVGRGWPHAVASAFAEDATGALWIGFDDGELVCVRDGAPHTIRPTSGAVAALLFDGSGRLWIASDTEGLLRIDDPAAPIAHRVPGLASQQTASLVDDAHGRIYVGSTRGIDRVDPATGEIAHFGRADGLPSENVLAAFRSRDGSLWFATKAGAARLVPAYAPPPARAPTYFVSVAIAGERRALAAGGTREATGFELGTDEDQLDIAVASPSFALGEQQRFQYRLDRDGAGTWSTPVAERALHFAKLAPGAYELHVRAAYPDGSTSPPATLAFVVLPPIWMRWWFVALVASAVAAAAYALYRWRLRHALAVERVRTRIATDLHDELGANLSRISILSEVAKRASGGEVAAKIESDAKRREVIDEIGKSARELVDVASDIVWSTDPRRDDLRAIVVRLRAFAGDVLEARGIAWRLDAPADPERIKLSPDRRRHVYLVVKEAIHNAARHAGAANVAIAIAHAGGALEATVRDDGRGFCEGDHAGNGLANMRARAAQAGGTLDIRTGPGEGTEVRLRVPLRGRG